MATLPEVIETERLRLRPWRWSDAGWYRRLWTERDPRVPQARRIDHLGRPDIGDMLANIARQRAEEACSGLALRVVEWRSGGAPLGYCGLIPLDGATSDAGVAYELFTEVHGRGVATEAATAVVAAARAMGLRRLVLGIWDWNVPSWAVARRLGAERGPATRHHPEHGDSHDWVITLSADPD